VTPEAVPLLNRQYQGTNNGLKGGKQLLGERGERRRTIYLQAEMNILESMLEYAMG
jgi:hypothetical protein